MLDVFRTFGKNKQKFSIFHIPNIIVKKYSIPSLEKIKKNIQKLLEISEKNMENFNNYGNGIIPQSDTAHIRFREKQPEEGVNCLSCLRIFPVTSYMDIIQHYRDIHHADYYKDCLYCKGKVHSYRKSKGHIEIYHDCLRWRRGMDN